MADEEDDLPDDDEEGTDDDGGDTDDTGDDDTGDDSSDDEESEEESDDEESGDDEEESDDEESDDEESDDEESDEEESDEESDEEESDEESDDEDSDEESDDEESDEESDDEDSEEDEESDDETEDSDDDEEESDDEESEDDESEDDEESDEESDDEDSDDEESEDDEDNERAAAGEDEEEGGGELADGDGVSGEGEEEGYLEDLLDEVADLNVVQSVSDFANAVAEDFIDDLGNWSPEQYAEAASHLFGDLAHFGESAEQMFLDLGYSLVSEDNRAQMDQLLDGILPGLKESLMLFDNNGQLVAKGVLTTLALKELKQQYPDVDTSEVQVVPSNDRAEREGATPLKPKPKILDDTTPADAVDLREYAPPVGNQKQTSRCAAFSHTHCVELIAKLRGAPYPRLAPSFTMLQFLKAQGDPFDFESAHSGGEGTVGGPAPGKVLVKTGVCRQDLWPDDDVEPKASLDEMEADAAKYKLMADPVAIKLDDVKAALSKGFPVILNMATGPEFSKIGRDGIVKEASAGKWKHGRHSMHIVGYRGNFYIVKNSWGTSWGDKGYCYMPKSVIAGSQPDLIMLAVKKAEK